MLKKSIATAGSVVLLTGLGAPGAQAQASRATAITGVSVTWADAEHTNIRITWSEDAQVANTLSVVQGGAAPAEFGWIPADAPNEYIIDSASFGNTANRADTSWVVVADTGNPAVQGRSPDFDRYLYQPPHVTAAFTTDGQVRWTVPADTGTDGTPNDPLDPTVETDRYLPIRQFDPSPTTANAECDLQDFPVTTASTGVVAPTGRPYELAVNPDNEWGARLGPKVAVTYTTGITISAPTATQYGTTTTITGQVTARGLPIGAACDEALVAVQNQPVVLHQRTSSTAAWTVVGTTKTDASGKYTAAVKNPGYREYRVVRSNTAGTGFAAYGGPASATKVVRSITRVVSAKFISPTITYGTQPQAYLWVDPAGNQRAALQYKNSTGAWQGVSYKTLSAGRGTLAFSWNRRGTFQFRWWVPAYGGADATYSPAFTLTVK